MKILITLFVLLFLSSVFADDISDFEIEGISIGDSLLDYFSEKVIKQNLNTDSYSNKKSKTFTYSEFKHSSFRIYDNVQFTFKRNDKKYKIYGITGAIFYEDINKCYEKQIDIAEDLSKIFEDAKKVNESGVHSKDTSGKSTIKGIFFDFKLGGYAQVSCYDWSNQMPGTDHIRIGVISKEFDNWLRSN